jgi:putative thioredoxin
MTTQPDVRRGAGPAVIEVDERTFQSAVLERSRATPVVVDFWAPWCGPCRVLGPTLERLAAEAQGAFVLAKINVDENPRLAQMFRVQGIPAVKAFRDGRVVDEFTGALPETQVRAWLKRLAPASAPSDDLVAAAAALEASAPAEAAARYRVALGGDPENDTALLGLGRVLVTQGEPEGVATLRQIQAGTPLYPRAQAWLTLARFFDEHSANGAAAPAQQVEQNIKDLEARYRLAASLARSRDYPGAIDQLLSIVERDRTFRDDGARKTLLALFEALGDDPIVGQGRRRLANLLF